MTSTGPVPRSADRSPGCSSPTSPGSSPGPYATMLLADLGAEVVKVEGPAGDDTRTWQPPVRDGVATYYLGVNRNKRSVALDLKDPDDLAAGPGARPAGRRGRWRTSGRADWRGSAWTTRPWRRCNPGVVYASISGFGSGRAGAALPGYDLIVQAISGLMSLTGSPTASRTAPASRCSTSWPGCTRRSASSRRSTAPRAGRGPARRGQPAVVGAVGAGQPDQRVRRRRRRPVPDGQQPPEPVPLRAAAVRRRRADHHRRQRRPVPQAVRGARRAGAAPTTRGSRATRTGRRTATSCGRCWSSGCRPARRWSGSARSSRPASRAGRSTPIDQGVALRRGGRPGPGRRWWGRAPRGAVGAQPDHLLAHAGGLPAAATDARRARRRDPTLAGRPAERVRGGRLSRPSCVPDVARHVHRRRDPAARART